MIDSYTDEILLRELETQQGVRVPQIESQLAAIVQHTFQGASNMYGRCGSGSWWRGGMGASFFGGGFPWGRGGRWGRFFGPGEIRLALLSMLESGPKHGYELMKELETKSAGIYKASAGAIYPALQQLEDEGLVTSDQASGKRTYSLTASGRAELQREADAVNRIWKRAEMAGEWAPFMAFGGAEVARPAAEVLKAATRVASRVSHDSAKIAKIREILERTRHEIEALDNQA